MAVWNSTAICPSSKSEIVSRGLSLGCHEGQEYHCLLDQNGVLGDICVPRALIEPVHCPEYHTKIRNLEVYTCDKNHGACPPAAYWSHTSFQYSGCVYTETSQRNTTESSSNLIPIVVLMAVIGLAVIGFITFISVWMYRRRQCRRNDEEYHLGEVQYSNDHERIPLLELDIDMLQKGIALMEHHQDTTYVPTQGFIWTIEVMLTHNVAVISGIVGSGKTKTALHTASTWKHDDENRRLLFIESINEIPDVLQRKLESVIIVMDDCFTRWTLEGTEGSLSSTCAELYRRVCHSNNVKLIITIDYNIYQRHKHWLSHIDLFKEHLIITLPIEKAGHADFTRHTPNMDELLQEERKKILQSHIDKHNAQEIHNIIAETKSQFHIALEDKDIKEIVSTLYLNIGFPSVCLMFVRWNEIAELKPDFFKFCDTRILKILDMESEGVKGKQKRCVLYYTMLKDKCLDLDDLDLGLLNKLGERYELEPYALDTVISIVKDLSKTFLIQTKNRIFKVADTVVHNKCIMKWIQKRPHDFLELCNVTLIKEVIRPVGYQPKSGESIFVVKGAAHIIHLAQRFKELLPTHPELENHPMMSNKDFQTEMEKDEQRREFTDNLYGNYDNTYEEIKDSVADPGKGGADI